MGWSLFAHDRMLAAMESLPATATGCDDWRAGERTIARLCGVRAVAENRRSVDGRHHGNDLRGIRGS
jgi:hypothetical protein